MEKLPGRPEKLNDRIFSELYENAEIINLTDKEMKACIKSVLEYDGSYLKTHILPIPNLYLFRPRTGDNIMQKKKKINAFLKQDEIVSLYGKLFRKKKNYVTE